MDVVLNAVRQANSNVGKFDVLARVCIAHDKGVGLDDFLQLDIGEVVERVDVLFDQALDTQESWKQIPLVASSIDRVCKRFAVVKWL
jgi:hypothetical protein